MNPITEIKGYRRQVFEILEQIAILDNREKQDLDVFSQTGDSCHLDPNIEDDDDEPFKGGGQGFWVDDNTSSEGTGGRNSGFSKDSDGESFTNTSESQSGAGSDGSLGDYKLGGAKFNQ